MNSVTNAVMGGATFSPKIMELRKKIHDADYINSAVQRIASVLSLKLIDGVPDPFAR